MNNETSKKKRTIQEILESKTSGEKIKNEERKSYS